MDRETLSWGLVAMAVLLAATAVCLWAYTVDLVSAGGGEFPLMHGTARLAIACAALALAALGAGLLLRIERRERLPRPGQCSCGYPLDPGMGKCPECGRVRWRS